jgi:rod shape-determining protein MreC
MRSQRNFAQALIITIATVTLILGLNFGLKLDLGQKFFNIISPVGIVVNNVGKSISGFFVNFSKIGSLYQENKDLKEKYNNSLSEIARLKDAGIENDSLKKDLGFIKNSDISFAPASVVSYNPDIHDGLVVRTVSSESLKVGAAVISEGFLVGKVSNVDGNIIKINLITDADSAIPAQINGKSITGIAKGKIGRGLLLDQVPQSEAVTAGDLVTTSGLGGDLPKSLIIGQVESVQKVSGSIFQQVNIKTQINLLALARVYIAR